ncbi:cytochrome c oxidase subunit 3, partial [Rickettsiella grylli]|uniref:cytochrome c oxidase subunit 3 n=1 Tax=Rickettsiella grylli TaxID=59196 RepID=UPI000AF5D886
MKKKDALYYVPEHSKWPIIGALALLFLAFGLLNIEKKWGFIAFIIGVVVLVFMLTGWFWNVAQERQAGLYSPQMDKTFRWGMVWFLIAELFLFGLLLGSIVHIRFSITPWLAGQGGDASQLTHYLLWPDFAKRWPLFIPPDAPTNQVNPVNSLLNYLPLINLIILLASAFCLSYTRYHFKKINDTHCRFS